MHWLAEALGGPVLAWETKQSTRRRFWKYLRIAYCAWLVVQAVTLFGTVLSSHRGLTYHVAHIQQIYFLDNYMKTLLEIQLALVIVLVPAVTASSLGQEKERGTLFALFGTDLTSRQILLGKLLGRLTLILPLVLTTLPALVFILVLTERGLAPLVLALGQEAIVAFAVGALCLLFGIWVTKATDATIASYLFLGLAYLAIRWHTDSMNEAIWFDPFENLDRMLSGESWLVFAVHLAAWACLGVVSLRLGWGRLRKVCVEQRDKRPSRRLWAFRPAISKDPFRWRECYVIGLTPMPILRLVPRWLALLGVLAFSAAIAGMIAESVAPGFFVALSNIDPVYALVKLQVRRNDISKHVTLIGVIFVLSASLLLVLRCGTSVAEEKRRNTWDDLLLTAQSFREITNGKMWGILQAIVPYIIAYAIPVFLLASIGGLDTFFLAALWIILPCTVVFVAALMGIDMLKVPPDMDETKQGGAFWFENKEAGKRLGGRPRERSKRA
jgi:hypothetical protein